MEFIGPRLRPGMRVLDVGCAAGVFLSMMRDRGCEPTGVEPEPAFAAHAREEFDLPVQQCLLEDAELADGSFDLVTASHVLEHTDSPSAFLTRLRELLTPNGLLFVEVPDLHQPRCSLRRVFHVAHRYNFTPSTLVRMVEKPGFEHIDLRALYRPGTVQVLAHRLDKPRSAEALVDSEDYRRTIRRLRWHRYGYYLSLMFIRRKLWRDV